jgi:hypothetical protein
MYSDVDHLHFKINVLLALSAASSIGILYQILRPRP